MSARLEELLINESESFRIGVFQDNLDKSHWHYHNHYEISFITEGTGKRIVGDSIEEFQPSDLVFIGKNLPHTWIAEPAPPSWSNRTLEMVFLQFSPELLTPHLLELPEFQYIKWAMKLSERGIQIVGKSLNEVSEIMLQLPYLKSFDRLMHFFQLMNIIGKSTENVSLASEEYITKRFQPLSKRIAIVHDYFMNNYKEKINLELLSHMVSMAPGSLCRYFHAKTGVTLFEYLQKIKVEFACKLLMDQDLSIIKVCLNSGYNNLSHFNKQFKKHTGMTPSLYRKTVIGRRNIFVKRTY